MGKTFLKETAKLMQDKTKKKRWHKVVISLSLVVALTTSYLLIEPALTMERTPQCGIEEHTHTAECYQRQLVCGQEEREAVPATEETVLNCPLEVHEHTAECYDEAGNLICGHEEHVHNDSCYQTIVTPGVEGHTHTDACYQDVLVCQKPEHVHSAACYPAEESQEATVDDNTVDFEANSETEGSGTTGDAQTEEVTYDACVLRADGADYNVQIECSADARIPAGATASVRELTENTTPQEYSGYYNAAVSKVSQLTGKVITYVRIFDVKIYDKDGNEIQPAVPVTVKFTYYSAAQNPAGNEVKAVYFGNETQLLNVETNEYNQAWNEGVIRNVNGVSVFAVGGIAVEQKEEPTSEPVADETVTEEPAESTEPTAEEDTVEEPAEQPTEGGEIIEGEDQTEETGKADDAEAVDIVEENPETEDASQETPDAEAANGEVSDGENSDSENVNPDGTTTDGETTENPDGEATDGETPDADQQNPEDTQNPEDAAKDGENTENPDAEPTEAPAEEGEASEEGDETEEVTEFADGVLEAAGADYTIQLSYTADAQIPENAELSVREIEKGTEEYDNYYQQAMAAVEDGDTTSIASARFFDITILVDGEEFEPAAPVEVKVAYANAVEVPQDGDVKSVHFGENAQVLDVQTNETDGAVDEVTFAADSFSVYGIVTREVLTGDVITADGETYTVTVSYGPEAKIPAGSTLNLHEYAEGDAQYIADRAAVMEAKRANGEEVDEENFSISALDISIADPEGNEVEPQSAVDVSIVRKYLPEDVDAATLEETTEVHHLIEEADGSVSVETVAGPDDAGSTVSVENGQMTMEFSTESFSDYVISGGVQNNKSFKFTVKHNNVEVQFVSWDYQNGRVTNVNQQVISADSETDTFTTSNGTSNNRNPSYIVIFFKPKDGYLITGTAHEGKSGGKDIPVANLELNETTNGKITWSGFTEIKDSYASDYTYYAGYTITSSFDCTFSIFSQPVTLDISATSSTGNQELNVGDTTDFTISMDPKLADNVTVDHINSFIVMVNGKSYTLIPQENNRDGKYYCTLRNYEVTEEDVRKGSVELTVSAELAYISKFSATFKNGNVYNFESKGTASNSATCKCPISPNKNLSISKIVEKDNDMSYVDLRSVGDFTFVVQAADANNRSLSGSYNVFYDKLNVDEASDTTSKISKIEFVEGKATINLKHGQEATVQLPNGCKYTVTETELPDSTKFKEVSSSDSSENTSITQQIVTGTLFGETTIAYVNEIKKGTIEFTKVDEKDNTKLLKDAEFGIYLNSQCSGSPIKTVKSDVDGKVSFGNVAVGTYYLKELAAPEDYDLSNDVYKVEVTDTDTVMKKVADRTETEITNKTVTNKLHCENITVKKVDGNNNNPLTGAEFKLSKKEGTADVTATSESGLTDGKFTVNDMNGATISGLPVGKYTLTEIKAPDGYVVLNNSVEFEITKDGVSMVGDSQIAYIDNNTIVVKNTAGTALPNTGGVGQKPFVMGGIALMLTALFAGFFWSTSQNKKRRKGN